MLSKHLIFCCLLLLSSIFPSISLCIHTHTHTHTHTQSYICIWIYMNWVTKSCPTLAYHIDSQAPLSMGFSEWLAISFSRGSSGPMNRSQGSCIAGKFFSDCTTKEALDMYEHILKYIYVYICICIYIFKCPLLYIELISLKVLVLYNYIKMMLSLDRGDI